MLKTIPLVLIAALSLTGCTPSQPQPSETAESSNSPGSTPLPEATGTGQPSNPADPNVLFEITVTATSPSGATADLTQTVYKPVASTSQQSADEATLDGECDGWRSAYSSPQFLVSEINITDTSPAGSSWDRSVAVASLNGWPVFSGSVSSFMAYCASVQVDLGASRGVTPVATLADGPGGWATYEYGFGIATVAGTDAPGPDDTVLSGCAIELSAEAQASAIASAWVVPGSPLSCLFRVS